MFMERLGSWRSVIIGLSALSLLALAACGGDSDATPATTPEATPAGQAQPTETPAFDPEAYFRGKTIDMLLGNPPGGGTDTQARYWAANWGPFFPGNPSFNVRNLTPNLSARNYMWTAPTDGFTMEHESSALRLALDEDPEAQFDTSEYRFIGMTDLPAADIWMVTKDVPYPTFVEAMGQTDFTIRVQASPNPEDWSSELNALLTADALEIPIEVIAYDAETNDLLLAVERGDLDGVSRGTVWPSLPTLRPGWAADGVLRPFMWLKPVGKELTFPTNSESNATAPDVYPYLEGDAKELYDAFMAPELGMGKHLILPPGTPDHIVEVYREAFWAAMNDPGFLEGLAPILGGEPKPTRGDELEETVKALDAGYERRAADFEPMVTQLAEKYTPSILEQ
jgi:hypothetical protein